MYIKCELQFYFAQVLRISEPDSISETIDAAVLGEIVHDALHQTYEAMKGNVITPGVIEKIVPGAILQVRKSFATKYNDEELSTGKNLLIVRVAENMVKRFLLAEKAYLEKTGSKIEIIMLEEPLESHVRITNPVNNEIINVKIHGKADRIDRVGGKIRIIDYKTGNVDAKELKTDQISSFREMKDSAKLLQVLTYALMFRDMHSDLHMELNSGIISLRKTSAYFIKSEINKSAAMDIGLLLTFQKELETLITHIFDTSEPFKQTENLETCSLCAFKTICNRTVNQDIS
jgi:CRISPR/Cas system-associated exonuclease Cas4 (RecB family)